MKENNLDFDNLLDETSGEGVTDEIRKLSPMLYRRCFNWFLIDLIKAGRSLNNT